MAERCYIHGPTTTAGTCPTCDAMQCDARDTEITRLRALVDEAEKAKADAWDEGYWAGHSDGASNRIAPDNPYRSKTDG